MLADEGGVRALQQVRIRFRLFLVTNAYIGRPNRVHGGEEIAGLYEVIPPFFWSCTMAYQLDKAAIVAFYSSACVLPTTSAVFSPILIALLLA